jgi:hypothetical protein
VRQKERDRGIDTEWGRDGGETDRETEGKKRGTIKRDGGIEAQHRDPERGRAT